MLAEVYEASRRETDRWQFAVERAELKATGLRTAELRFMIGQGLVRHAVETTGPRSCRRTFRPVSGMLLPAKCCLVLTDLGAAVAAAIAAASQSHTNGSVGAAILHPTWDKVRRVLRWGDLVLKVFHQPAASQQLILEVFEEEGWPERIDDPLPGKNGADANQHMRDTIKNLNRAHHVELIRFHGDGSGEGIGWDVVAGGH